jgi:hypothetical protein
MAGSFMSSAKNGCVIAVIIAGSREKMFKSGGVYCNFFAEQIPTH